MDQSNQLSSPSEKLSALSTMNLNSTPTKRARDGITLDTSSPSSVFDRTPPFGSRSIGGSPSVASSPCPGGPIERGPRSISFPTYPPMRRPSAKYAAFGQPSSAKHSPELPTEIWDMIFNEATAMASREEWNIFDGNIYENPNTKQILSTLRLVCQNWNRIISPRLFSHISAMVGRIAGRPLEAVLRVSESQFAPYVHELRIGILGPWQTGLQYEQYITDLAQGALPVLLARFQNLKTFRLQSPSMIAALCPEDQISMALLSQLTSSFVHSLRFVGLPRLRSLHLSLPVTAEFGRFFVSEGYVTDFENILDQIQEMHFIINDDTGREGFREIKRPRSQVKGRYPLQNFADYLTSFIGYAKKIKVLSVEVRSRFDISNLTTTNFTQLTHLRLLGVSIKWETLRDIVRSARSTLLRVELENVQLSSGTWEDVFNVFVEASDIYFFATSGLGYSATGSSAHHIGHATHFWPTSVLTKHWSDFDGLANIRKLVNDNRVRLGLMASPRSTWVPRPSWGP